MVAESGIGEVSEARRPARLLAYYSPAMAPPRARSPRRRARRGASERPVNAQLVRGAWLLVALPLLVAAFTVARPAALPKPPLPPAFDTPTALRLPRVPPPADPGRSAGRAGGGGGGAPHAPPAGAGGRRPGGSPVPPPRASTGVGPGANDNASGTA